MPKRTALTVSTAQGDTPYDVTSIENGMHHYQVPFVSQAGPNPGPSAAQNVQHLYFPTWMTYLKKMFLNIQGRHNSSQEPVDIWVWPSGDALTSPRTLVLFAHFALCHSESAQGASPGVRLSLYRTSKVLKNISTVQIYTVAVGPNALGYNSMIHRAKAEELVQQIRRTGESEKDSMAQRLCELILRYKQKSESKRFDNNLKKEGCALLHQLLTFSALKRPVSMLSMSTQCALNAALNISLFHPTKEQADNALMELKTQIPTQLYNQITEKVKSMVYSPTPLATLTSPSLPLSPTT